MTICDLECCSIWVTTFDFLFICK